MITLLLALPLLARVAQQPPAPRRTVPDPGGVASLQKATPAGVQSIFEGRVTGVRFGTTPGELWVAVPGYAYHLSWSDNRVLARGALGGRGGGPAVAFPPVKKRTPVPP